jgi:hypothetical protein
MKWFIIDKLLTFISCSMSYNLFLDDKRNPSDIWNHIKSPEYAVYNWVIVKDYNSFVQTIQDNGIPVRISFDHNLSDEHIIRQNKTKINYSSYKDKTGYDCAVWLIEYCLDYEISLPKYKIHAEEGLGKQNIENLLESFDKYQKSINKKK